MNKITILDANAILRYILYDIPEQAIITREIMAVGEVRILHEIIAEVIYVMNKVYKIPRENVADYIDNFFDDAKCKNKLLINAVRNFGVLNLDFVDCLLLEYSSETEYEVFTFDEKLLKAIQKVKNKGTK